MAGKFSFSPSDFQEAAIKYRKELLYLPIIGCNDTLQQTKGTVLLVYLWHMYGAHTVCRPKVTMFAVEMWFGAGDGVECGRSTGLCPLPLGVPLCVIHNKKMLERNFGNFEKKIILTTKTIPTMQRNKKTFK